MDDETALIAFEAGGPQDVTAAREWLARRYFSPLVGLVFRRLTRDEDISVDAATCAFTELFQLGNSDEGQQQLRRMAVGRNQPWLWLMRRAKSRAISAIQRRDRIRTVTLGGDNTTWRNEDPPDGVGIVAIDSRPGPADIVISREEEGDAARISVQIKAEITKLVDEFDDADRALLLWLIHLRTELFEEVGLAGLAEYYREQWAEADVTTRSRFERRVRRILERVKAVLERRNG